MAALVLSLTKYHAADDKTVRLQIFVTVCISCISLVVLPLPELKTFVCMVDEEERGRPIMVLRESNGGRVI